MTALRVLIVDDEPLARQRLLHLLAEIPGTEVVGECGDGADGLLALEPSTPHGTVATIRIPYRVCPVEATPPSADA